MSEGNEREGVQKCFSKRPENSEVGDVSIDRDVGFQGNGHLSLSPSNHRRYRRSPIGDLFAGDPGVSVDAIDVDRVSETAPPEPEVAGRPAISSCISVTTSPREVISLLRTIRLCGKRLREV